MTRKTLAQLKTDRSKSKMLEYLTDSGNISFSCKRTGISRETYYRWIDEDRPFGAKALEAIDFGKTFINDLAHSHLVQHIQNGHMQAIRFQLSNCHPDYRPKVPMRETPDPVDRIELYKASDHADFKDKGIEPFETITVSK